MYHFRDWTIEVQMEKTLEGMVDKEENNFILFDEEKDVFLWISSSKFGEGFSFQKINWTTQFNVLPLEKKIIIVSLEQPEEQ
ncbi:hypothetical protein [Bacillus sp. OTU530]|uniref:hypothetical protein n=1 Tax=Bacillus sp. OTU530 TaxID=3043862 RepID=UPI00313C4899